MKLEALLRQIVAMDMPHVTIYPGKRIGTGTKAAFSTADCVDDVDAIDAPRAANLLELFMADVEDGHYTARLKKGTKGGANEREIPFYKGIQQDALSVTQQTITGPWSTIENPQQYIADQLQAFKDKLLAEKQREEQEVRISGLEEELRQARSWEPKVEFLGRVVIEGLVEKLGFPAKAIGDIARVSDPVLPQPDDAIQGTEGANPEDPDYGDMTPEEIRVHKGINVIADKLGDQTPELIDKLATLDPDKLLKLAQLPSEVITAVTSSL